MSTARPGGAGPPLLSWRGSSTATAIGAPTTRSKSSSDSDHRSLAGSGRKSLFSSTSGRLGGALQYILLEQPKTPLSWTLLPPCELKRNPRKCKYTSFRRYDLRMPLPARACLRVTPLPPSCCAASFRAVAPSSTLEEEESAKGNDNFFLPSLEPVQGD